jgi:hypothetical protein
VPSRMRCQGPRDEIGPVETGPFDSDMAAEAVDPLVLVASGSARPGACASRCVPPCNMTSPQHLMDAWHA